MKYFLENFENEKSKSNFRLNSEKFRNFNFEPKLSLLKGIHKKDEFPQFLQIRPIYVFVQFFT